MQKPKNPSKKQPPSKKLPPKSQQSNDRPVNSPDKHYQTPTKSNNRFMMENLNNAIHEYLLKNNFLKTLGMFQEELLKIYSNNRSFEENDFEKQMIEAFETGNRDFFYEKWSNFVPSFKSLDKNTVAKYKKYLETKGSELSKTSEFLPYYALPYIQKPQEHPALKELFTKEWILNLRSKLLEFLTNLFSSSPPILLRLFSSYPPPSPSHPSSSHPPTSNLPPSSHLPSSSQHPPSSSHHPPSSSFHPPPSPSPSYLSYISQLENNNKELVSVIQEFNLKYNQIQKNYKQFAESAKTNLLESQNKWSALARELVNISKEFIGIFSQQGGDGGRVEELAGKVGKYERFLNTNLEEYFRGGEEVSIFEKGEENVSPITKRNESYYGHDGDISAKIISSTYSAVNYTKIKELIKNLNPDYNQVKCALLQALRWRITRTRHAQIRREVVTSFSVYDVLGCNERGEGAMNGLMNNEDQRIREFTLRLINSMASEYLGRSYLVKNDRTVNSLIEILKIEKKDSLIRRNTLGALQKLSLRKRPQLLMIENDLIRWIVDTLKNEKENLSEYSIEYITALFMNLSLRSAGKFKCEGEAKIDVLQVLNDLLEHENMQVRTFVNGTLYSLFSRSAMREQAKAIGMQEILKYLMEHSDERFTKQIQYIIDQLNSEKESDELSESNDEDNDVDDMDEDDDVIEEEDIEENLSLDPDFPVGEELINREFGLPPEDGQKQISIIKSILEEKKNLNMNTYYKDKENRNSEVPFNRPTTPILSANVSVIHHNNERITPSELQSRPKILRTPNEITKSHPPATKHDDYKEEPVKDVSINNSIVYNQEISPYMDEKKIELRKMAQVSNEYKEAFESRSKIIRTPPIQKK